MVCDARWTDFDNDGAVDLVIAGEWMPLSFFKNNKGNFGDVTGKTGIDKEVGWWNSIAAGDFDNDGDMDYIAGNLGENSFYRASKQFPVNVYAKDFDNNKSFDAITTVYLKDQQGIRKEFTAQNRDDIMEQLPPLKKKFLTYKDFAKADINNMFSADTLKQALKLSATNFQTSYLNNLGNGKFKVEPMPVLSQLAPVYGMIVDDYNNDGNLDVVLSGNDYGTEVSNGRYNALNGLVLLGDGKGGFVPQAILKSGFFTPGDAKALIRLKGANNEYFLAASENRGPLKIFKHAGENQQMIPYSPLDRAVYITLTNGKTRKTECYPGSAYLSQSAPFILINNTVKKVEIINNKGEKKVMAF